MKTIKTFNFKELNIYKYSGDKLAIKVRDLLNRDRVEVFPTFHTDSRGGSSDEPAAIFVEENILNDHGFEPCTWYINYWPMEFILIPVVYGVDDFDVWIPLSKFNSCFSEQEREELARRNPKYFSDKPQKKLGFFTEDNNIDEEYEEIHVNSGQSWKIKTGGQNCYKVKILLPTRTNRFNTFRWSVVHQTPGGLGAGYQEACFLTQHEAEEFIQRHNLDEQYPSRYGEWYAYPARVDLNLIKVPLEGGEEIHIRTECLPRTTGWNGEDDPAGLEWWEKVRRLFPRYFSEQPVRRLGFFNEAISTDLNIDQVWEIMEDTSLSGEEKSQRLFGRPEDYVANLQYLCMTAEDFLVEYLRDHGYITQEGMELSLRELTGQLGGAGSRACGSAGDVIRGEYGSNDRIEVNTVFYGSSRILSLDLSWQYYVSNRINRHPRKFTREVGYNWYKYIKHCIDKFEETPYVQWKKPKRLGFFNESISKNFTDDDQIRSIMENDTLSLEEKSRRLFGRDPEHVFLFGLASWYISKELYDLAEENGKEEFDSNVDRRRYHNLDTHTITISSLMCYSNHNEPLNIQESYDLYVRGDTSKYEHGGSGFNIGGVSPHDWWLYIKTVVEVFEDAVGYKAKRLGFFSN